MWKDYKGFCIYKQGPINLSAQYFYYSMRNALCFPSFTITLKGQHKSHVLFMRLKRDWVKLLPGYTANDGVQNYLTPKHGLFISTPRPELLARLSVWKQPFLLSLRLLHLKSNSLSLWVCPSEQALSLKISFFKPRHNLLVYIIGPWSSHSNLYTQASFSHTGCVSCSVMLDSLWPHGL